MMLPVMAAVALASAGGQFAQQPPLTPMDEFDPLPAELEEVIVDRDRYERMTVSVSIGDSGPYRFLVDTGAQATVVTHRIVDDLQLVPDGRALLVAMGSSEVVPTVELDRLKFANRSIDDLRAPLLEWRNIGADGILGLDSLQDLRVLMDFEEDRITVADASALGGNNGFEIVVRARRKLGQMIITDAYLNGVRTNVIIDTGAQRSFGNAALERRLRSKEAGTEIATDVHGFELAHQLRLTRELTIGGVSLRDLAVGFTQSPIFAALELEEGPALVLGMGDLRAFRRVAIDFDARRILFDLPRDVASDLLRRRGGLGPSARW